MPRIEDQDESRAAIVAGGLRLAFAWEGDRWVHALERDGDGEPRALARSFEVGGDLFDPARVVSPAFQQINFQAAGPGKAQALLVGQAGPHHFSAVFEVEHAPPGPVRIAVEVADRCRGPVGSLASTYRVEADSGQLAAGGAGEIRWEFGPDRLGFRADPPVQVAFDDAGGRGTRVQAVAPGGSTAAATGPVTHRWAYSWEWQSGDRP